MFKCVVKIHFKKCQTLKCLTRIIYVAVDTDADHRKVSHLQALFPFASLVKRSFVYVQSGPIF